MFIYDCIPKRAEELGYQQEILQRLIHLAGDEEAQHVILSGPHGSGKRVLLGMYLEALYDSQWRDIKHAEHEIPGSTKKKKKVYIATSPYHIEITSSKTDSDKRVLLEVIRKYASYGMFDFYQKGRSFKTIVIHEADRLTVNSQATLRQTIEKHVRGCRFILLCRDLTSLVAPLRSRCAVFYLPPPTTEQVDNYVTKIALRHGLQYREETRAAVRAEGGDLRRALWHLDSERMNIPLQLGNDDAYQRLVTELLGVGSGTSPPLLLYRQLRRQIYSILITVVDRPEIIQNIVRTIIPRVPEEIGYQIITLAAEAERAQAKGRRSIIIHVDMFLAGVMRVLLSNPN